MCEPTTEPALTAESVPVVSRREFFASSSAGLAAGAVAVTGLAGCTASTMAAGAIPAISSAHCGVSSSQDG